MSTPFTMDDAKQMLKEILASTTDLQKRMVAQEDRLETLSGEVASLKVDQGRLHVAVNKVQSSQLNHAAKNDGPIGATDDEPQNVDSSQAGGMASALLNAASHKLRFPKYDGTEDPLLWLNRYDQFFRATRTPDNEKVLLAAFYMQGVTQQWYYTLEHNQGTPTWARFTELVNQRFGPPSRSNPLGELCHLRRQGSVADYTKAFLTHLSRCDTITEPHQVAIFTAGLGEPLQTDVELQRPASLEDAMGLARAYERRSTAVAPPSTPAALRSSSKPSGITTTPTPQPTTTTTLGAPVKPRAPPGTRLSRLTLEEMARRREEGLCFNCPEKFSRDHLKQCSKKGIYLLEMDGDDFAGDIFVDDSGIEISLNALSGMSTGQTMRLGVAMRNQSLIALVDSGPTHCFMAEHVARQLDLRPVPRAGMTVGVANGERLPCVGVCPALSFSIHGEVFCMDFFVTTLDGYEVVLGCN
jgi:hypothetical protein